MIRGNHRIGDVRPLDSHPPRSGGWLGRDPHGNHYLVDTLAPHPVGKVGC